jgi:cell division protease FtsH
MVAVTIGIFIVFNFVAAGNRSADATGQVTLDELQGFIAAGQVETAIIRQDADVVEGTLKTGALPNDQTEFVTNYPNEFEDELTEQLLAGGSSVEVERDGVSALSVIVGFLPLLLFVGIGVFMFRAMRRSGNGLLSIGRSRARTFDPDQPSVKFSDVAGLSEAVEEIREIKEFLESPARFRSMGAKLPGGVLLVGPPGTGKTLLARATAGEAGTPFLSISGSDFVEMFVGVGASRVRDLFRQAKAMAPVIIFIDEIDAVGQHRGTGLGGGNDEREQTLNQLLVEMDGFDMATGVVVIAATNRPDVLDPALLRPGRFDRQIVLDLPDLRGRRQILEVHAQGKPLSDEVDLEVVARQTPGFTGADLANLFNEAVLLAVRRGKAHATPIELEDALDKLLAGPERRSTILSLDERKVIAAHEAGHALVGWALPCADPIHKVTIIPRGRSLGYTRALPTADRHLLHRSQLWNQLAMLVGGRVAEEVVFGDPTTGASNDLEKATQIARQMVLEFGMSERLGFVRLGRGGDPFLGRRLGLPQEISDETAAAVDAEVRALLDAAQDEAQAIITFHRADLEAMAEALLDQETLEQTEIAQVFGRVPKWRRSPGAVREIHPSPSPNETPRGKLQAV